MIKEDSFNTIT